jgi:hypothetical protein
MGIDVGGAIRPKNNYPYPKWVDNLNQIPWGIKIIDFK